ncbi:hypothetical protein [Candidatus Lokiarchaeum ossiferum]|uniref:hypothetical protein n=1 Tax=Candidatus Lokiarchaeum ossiferum TaxID=2951803 RepID=UPI00352CEB6E
MKIVITHLTILSICHGFVENEKLFYELTLFAPHQMKKVFETYIENKSKKKRVKYQTKANELYKKIKFISISPLVGQEDLEDLESIYEKTRKITSSIDIWDNSKKNKNGNFPIPYLNNLDVKKLLEEATQSQEEPVILAGVEKPMKMNFWITIS